VLCERSSFVFGCDWAALRNSVNIILRPLISGVWPEQILRRVYPEPKTEILRVAQDDGRRRTQDDGRRRTQDDQRSAERVGLGRVKVGWIKRSELPSSCANLE
jgi:hypothetical protein